METWKDIRGYEGIYQISDLGRIRSLGTREKKARILLQEITIHGYCRVRLYNAQGEAKHWAVHRLVVSHFIGDCGNLQVNHKNEIKTDNRVENLELVTPGENCNHGTRNQRIAEILYNSEKLKRTPVVQCDLKTGAPIKAYPSMLQAERETGIHNGTIRGCLIGKNKSAGGYAWRMKDA